MVTRVAGMLVLILVARHLQPDGFGVYSVLGTYFGLAVVVGALGLDRLTLRDMSLHPDFTGSSFLTLFYLRSVAALASGTLLICAAWMLRPELIAAVGAVVAATIPAAVASSLAAGFQGREQFGVPSAASVVSAAAATLWGCLGVFLEATLEFLIWGLAVTETARAGWLLIAAHRAGLRLLPCFDAQFARYAVRAAFPYAAMSVLGVVYLRIDLIMLDLLLPGAEVGLYASAYRILEILSVLPALVMGVLFPRLARLQESELGGARMLYLTATRLLAWLGLSVAAVVVALSRPIIQSLYGHNYEAAAPLLVVLAVAVALLYWHAPNVAALLASNRLHVVVALSFGTAGFNVLLNILWIPQYGAMGAAAATAISEALSLVIFTLVVCYRLGVPAASYLRAIQSPWLSRRDVSYLMDLPPVAPTYNVR